MAILRSVLTVMISALALAACHKEQAADARAKASAAAAIPAPPGGWAAQATRMPDGGVRIGNPQAPVKMIEFGSRTCPACGAFAREGFKPLVANYVATGKVSFEFHDFLIHAPDLAATLLGSCGSVTSFLPILEQMYADQPRVLAKLESLPPGFQETMQGKTPSEQAKAWADLLGYTTFVAQRGVPRARSAACLSDRAAIDRIASQVQTATTTYNIDHTPTFIINGANQGDATTWPAIKGRLDTALGA